jgi:hypothetical protein
VGSLPGINSLQELLPALKIWQQSLTPVISAPVPPRSPFSFSANGGAAGATGITLNWEVVRGADGYEVQSSTNGDFSAAPIIAALQSVVATSFFDSTVVTNIKRYYRMRATNGSHAAPHSIKGAWTAVISATSGSGTTTFDQVSKSSGTGGWNAGNNPGIGSRFTGTRLSGRSTL